MPFGRRGKYIVSDLYQMRDQARGAEKQRKAAVMMQYALEWRQELEAAGGDHFEEWTELERLEAMAEKMMQSGARITRAGGRPSSHTPFQLALLAVVLAASVVHG